MCLIIEKQEPQVATEDMIVYKVLTTAMNGPMYAFNYVCDELYITIMEETDDFCTADDTARRSADKAFGVDWRTNAKNKRIPVVSIGQGFHSCKDVDRAKLIKGSYITDFGLAIYKATIPKGSLYYKDLTGLIVSNQIIINEKVE